MTTATLQNPITSNKKLLVLTVMLLLSGVGMFGQQTKTAFEVPVVNGAQVAVNGADDDSNIELVTWFMASKQTQFTGAVTSEISTNNTGKKQFINCGMTPNRILSRAFLKKVINYDSTIA